MSAFLTVRTALLLVLALSGALLAGALLFEHLGGLRPCPLCYAQRWAHWAAAALAAGALALGLRGEAGREWEAPLLGGAVAALLAGAGTAGFHVGVEAKWWPGLAFCGGLDANAPLTLDGISAALGADLAAPRCDEVAWSLLGISMAGYNGLISLGGAAAGIFALVRDTRLPQAELAA
jgi:disulfide bond formation protein DsbB